MQARSTLVGSVLKGSPRCGLVHGPFLLRLPSTGRVQLSKRAAAVKDTLNTSEAQNATDQASLVEQTIAEIQNEQLEHVEVEATQDLGTETPSPDEQPLERVFDVEFMIYQQGKHEVFTTFVLGEAGERRKRLMEKHSLSLLVNNVGKRRIAVFKIRTSHIKAVADLWQDILQEAAEEGAQIMDMSESGNLTKLSMMIPGYIVGQLLGPGGSHLKGIIKQTGGLMQLQDRENAERIAGGARVLRMAFRSQEQLIAGITEVLELLAQSQRFGVPVVDNEEAESDS